MINAQLEKLTSLVQVIVQEVNEQKRKAEFERQLADIEARKEAERQAQRDFDQKVQRPFEP